MHSIGCRHRFLSCFTTYALFPVEFWEWIRLHKPHECVSIQSENSLIKNGILVQRLRLHVGICKRSERWTENIKGDSDFDWNCYRFAIWIFIVNSSENVNIFMYFFLFSVRKFDPNCGCACCDWLYIFIFIWRKHTQTQSR